VELVAKSEQTGQDMSASRTFLVFVEDGRLHFEPVSWPGTQGPDIPMTLRGGDGGSVNVGPGEYRAGDASGHGKGGDLIIRGGDGAAAIPPSPPESPGR